MLAALAVALAATAAVPLFTEERGGEQPPAVETSQNATGSDVGGGPDLPVGPFIVALIVVGLLAIGVQFATQPWKTLKRAVGLVLVVAVVLGIARLLTDLNPPDRGREQEFAGRNATATATPNGSSGFGEGTIDPLALPVDAFGAIALAAGVAIVAALVAWRSDTVRAAFGLAAGSEDADAGLDAVARVAGEAADRVAAADSPTAADNAIYRAWAEMVALLDAPDPQSGTPRQFAAAAIEAGMDPDDVAILTRTFEEVRYGGASLSEERRERATTALRRIEAAHADADRERDGAGVAPETDTVPDVDVDRDPGGAG